MSNSPLPKVDVLKKVHTYTVDLNIGKRIAGEDTFKTVILSIEEMIWGENKGYEAKFDLGEGCIAILGRADSELGAVKAALNELSENEALRNKVIGQQKGGKWGLFS